MHDDQLTVNAAWSIMGRPRRTNRPPDKQTGDPVFGAVLEAARMAKGLSQTQTAKLIGSNHSCIARIENGTRFVSRGMAERLAEVFGDDMMIKAGYLPRGYIAVKERV